MARRIVILRGSMVEQDQNVDLQRAGVNANRKLDRLDLGIRIPALEMIGIREICLGIGGIE